MDDHDHDDDQDRLARQLERHRPHLRAVAYRMLGSLAEADDAVQDAWLRMSGADPSAIESPRAWMTTIVARVSLNRLRARRSRPEQLVDPLVPDPIVDRADGADPEHEALIADAVGMALVVVLQTLAPAERLAYVLHDMFDVPFAEIAPIVDRTPDSARQLASRARRRVRGAAPEPEGDLAEQAAVVEAYLAASREGDFQALIAVLDPDVELRADGGPGRPEATVQVRGAEAVAGRALAHARHGLVAHPVRVNGAAGVVFTRDGSPYSLVAMTVSGGRIAALHIIADPERLVRLSLTSVIELP